jgi:hypothetical protein
VYAEVQRASGIVVRFARVDRKRHQNSHTFYRAVRRSLRDAGLVER